MTERSSSTVPIIVAVIGVAGTIATALIANWDKLSGSRRGDEPTVAGGSTNAAGAAAPGTGATAKGLGMDAAVPVNVAGKWVDAGGYEFVFEQTGIQYTFTQYKDGQFIGTGAGALTGRRFKHNFAGSFGAGDCAGEVSSDGNTSSGTCTSGGNNWDFRVVRSGGNAKI